MIALILLVVTPVPEKVLDWLSVSQAPAKADLIVCLGGRYERLLWAADLYERGFAPRVAVSNAPGAATFMKRLLTGCGVPARDILVDSTSYNTGDHPAGIAHLDKIDPLTQRFILVTDYEHSRRAVACFRRAGYRHVTVFSGPHPLRDDQGRVAMWKWRFMYLPRLVYECAGLLQYWVQGRI